MRLLVIVSHAFTRRVPNAAVSYFSSPQPRGKSNARHCGSFARPPTEHPNYSKSPCKRQGRVFEISDRIKARRNEIMVRTKSRQSWESGRLGDAPLPIRRDGFAARERRGCFGAMRSAEKVLCISDKSGAWSRLSHESTFAGPT